MTQAEFLERKKIHEFKNYNRQILIKIKNRCQRRSKVVQKRNPQRSSIANSNTGAFGIIKGAEFIIVEKFNLLIDEKQRSFNGIFVDFRQYY